MTCQQIAHACRMHMHHASCCARPPRRRHRTTAHPASSRLVSIDAIQPDYKEHVHGGWRRPSTSDIACARVVSCVCVCVHPRASSVDPATYSRVSKPATAPAGVSSHEG
jgi:hypothetical protein